MNIYENLATQALTSFFYKEPLWKKELLYNFLVKPFKLQFSDITDVKTQDNLKESIPDFTIETKKGERLRFEVKINDSGLTQAERNDSTRDAYLIRKNYYYLTDIPVSKDKILYWEDLFAIIDQKDATKDFSRFDLLREYMNEDIHTNLLTPHEVAMLYSKDTIIAVYRMKEKVKNLCNTFLDERKSLYKKKQAQDNEFGIGYYFDEIKNEKRHFFIGFSPYEEKYFSIAKRKDKTTDSWDFFELDKEILAKYDTDEQLQEAFNKNVESVLGNI